MTDQTDAKPRPLKVTTCYDPTGRTVSCHALVEDTDESRREHRLWHKHEEGVKDGLRKALREARDEIATVSREVADVGRDVKDIELPEATLGIEINRDGWTDPDDDPDDEDDVYADESQEPAGDDEPGLAAPVDPSGLYTPHTGATPTSYNALP